MKKQKITERDYIKANRKASREEEIESHTRPVGVQRVHKSKKVYNRKKVKADENKGLPYFFILYCSIAKNEKRDSSVRGYLAC